jgi:arylsulfatase A-like enzyme
MIADVRRDDQHSIDQGRTEAFERFIETKWDCSKPFFFALGFHSTHQPNEANQRYYDQYALENMPLTVPPEGATSMTKPFPPNFDWWSKNYPEKEQRQAVQGYYAAVTLLDDMTGRAMQYLEDQGIADNTIIVFTSDQGYNLGYRDVWAKHILYPSVLRVPLIVRYPGMPNRGARAEGLVELLDIFPTLTELAGLPTPVGLDGESFVPLMENPAKEGKPAAYAQGILHNGNGIAVTTKEGTYMEWDKGAFREFYDLTKDPAAWFNQVNNPEYGVSIRLHEKLLHDFSSSKPLFSSLTSDVFRHSRQDNR